MSPQPLGNPHEILDRLPQLIEAGAARVSHRVIEGEGVVGVPGSDGLDWHRRCEAHRWAMGPFVSETQAREVVCPACALGTDRGFQTFRNLQQRIEVLTESHR